MAAHCLLLSSMTSLHPMRRNMSHAVLKRNSFDHCDCPAVYSATEWRTIAGETVAMWQHKSLRRSSAARDAGVSISEEHTHRVRVRSSRASITGSRPRRRSKSPVSQMVAGRFADPTDSRPVNSRTGQLATWGLNTIRGPLRQFAETFAWNMTDNRD